MERVSSHGFTNGLGHRYSAQQFRDGVSDGGVSRHRDAINAVVAT